MRQRLEQAAQAAKAAYGCAAAGSPEKGIEIASDLEQDLRDAKKFLEGILAVNRCAKS